MTHSSTPAGLCIVRACRGHERNAYNTHEELEKKRGEITSLPREEKRREDGRRSKGEKLGTNGDGTDVKKGKIGVKIEREKMVGERREEEWESWKTRCAPLRPSTDGDRGTANSVGSYSRRPAGALQHATSACRSRPNVRLRLTSAPNKTTNFARRPLRLAPFRHPRYAAPVASLRATCSGLRVRLATPLPPSRRDVGHRARYSTITSRKTLNSPVSFSLGVILI